MKYAELVRTIDTANRQLLSRAAEVVNQALILRNWLVSANIVEYEQSGNDRAKYGIPSGRLTIKPSAEENVRQSLAQRATS